MKNTAESPKINHNFTGVVRAEKNAESPINNSRNTQRVEGSTQGCHSYEDGTEFFMGLTYKNKDELVVPLCFAVVKNNFNFQKVNNTKKIYNVKCVYKNCKWQLQAVKFKNVHKFRIRKYNNRHTCGVQHLTSHHRHASARIVARHIKNKFVEGKGLSIKAIKKIIRVKL